VKKVFSLSLCAGELKTLNYERGSKGVQVEQVGMLRQGKITRIV
jgi:hypothetical protein